MSLSFFTTFKGKFLCGIFINRILNFISEKQNRRPYMNPSHPLFKALFHTSVPRVILKANAPDFTIVDYNHAYLQATDGGESDFRGKNLWTVYTPTNSSIQGAALLSEALDLVLKTRNSLTMNPFRYDVVPTNGGAISEHWWQIEIIPIKDEMDVVESLLLNTNDVTQLTIHIGETRELRAREQDLNEELAATNEELLASNEELMATIEELHNAQEQLGILNEQLEDKVAERTIQLSTIIQNIPAGLAIVSGKEMLFDIANKGILKLWGKEDEVVVGRTVTDVFPEMKTQAFPEILDQVFETGVSYSDTNSPVVYRGKNGGMITRYRDFSYTPLKNKNNQTYAIVVLTEDVTERFEIRQREQELNEELTAINEELSSSVEELAATNEELNQAQDNLMNKIAEQSLTNQKLILSEERQRFLLNAIPQQVWTAETKGTLNYVNDVICRDLNKSAEEIIKKGWQAFIHPDDVHETMRKWITALHNGHEYLAEFRLLFADGEYHWFLARAIPFVDDGKITMWLGTNTNIDLQKNNEYKKDEFLSIASHELKTPLTSIKAYNQLNLRKNKDVSLTPMLDKVSKQTSRLEKLINDLLDVTKINAGKMNYAMQPFHFSKMLKDAVESAQHLSGSHEIVLEDHTDVHYTGDVYRLEQVLNNFLSNAVKYSPDASKVLVKSRVSHGNIIVSVQDFGIGIAAESLNKLFERYYRVDNTAMKFEGLGLGLFISSEILKRHHGSFWIESEEGKGSIFFFRLPMNITKSKPFEVKTDTFFRSTSIVVNCNISKARLDVDWIGFQNLETVQEGCMAILEMIKTNQVSKIVNDNTHVLGSWAEAADWVSEIWLPMAAEAGLKIIAWVYSPVVFAQLATKKSVEAFSKRITVQQFSDIRSAEKWTDAI